MAAEEILILFIATKFTSQYRKWELGPARQRTIVATPKVFALFCTRFASKSTVLGRVLDEKIDKNRRIPTALL